VSEPALYNHFLFLFQQEDDLTFSALFIKIQSGVFATIVVSEHLVQSVLDKVYVGASKDEFSLVELTHSVVSVCGMFGSFIKFIVICEEATLNSGQQLLAKRRSQDIDADNNALVSASKRIPPLLSKEKNQKDALYSVFLKFLATHGLGWEEPNVYGKQFASDICNLLWYIDGHHQVFASRSCEITA
jgi:hypothetical protein